MLIMGPSGVGKTRVIRRLRVIDGRFTYVAPFTTRPLRNGETDKVTVTHSHLADLNRQGKLLTVNSIYGFLYGTPKEPIEVALRRGLFPVLDWPVSRLDVMCSFLPDQLHRVYLEPPSIGVLRGRLRDGRDPDGERLQAGLKELAALWQGYYDGLIDHRVVSVGGDEELVARAIYGQYLTVLGLHSG